MRAITSIELVELHERTVALQFSVRGRNKVVKGRGFCELDAEMGRVLKIELPAEAGTELILDVARFQGEIEPGEDAGCDYLIRLN